MQHFKFTLRETYPDSGLLTGHPSIRRARGEPPLQHRFRQPRPSHRAVFCSDIRLVTSLRSDCAAASVQGLA